MSRANAKERLILIPSKISFNNRNGTQKLFNTEGQKPVPGKINHRNLLDKFSSLVSDKRLNVMLKKTKCIPLTKALEENSHSNSYKEPIVKSVLSSRCKYSKSNELKNAYKRYHASRITIGTMKPCIRIMNKSIKDDVTERNDRNSLEISNSLKFSTLTERKILNDTNSTAHRYSNVSANYPIISSRISDSIEGRILLSSLLLHKTQAKEIRVCYITPYRIYRLIVLMNKQLNVNFANIKTR